MDNRNMLYIIHDNYGNTYNGYTVDVNRRIRQHNKCKAGGAKYTTKRVTDENKWNYLLIITCTNEEFNKNKALSMEWSIKYPTNRKPRPRIYNKPKGRIESLPLVFANPKFSDFNYIVYVQQNMIETLISFNIPNIVIKDLQEFN